MSIKGRLERLEESAQAEEAVRPSREDEEKRLWMVRARMRRQDNMNREEWHAADVIRTLRLQGRLGNTAEELRARLLAWNPMDPGAAGMELAQTIYLQEPGTENMVCPPGWRDALEARDELRERYAAVADEVLARWLVGRWEAEERGEDETERKTADEAARYGITDALLWRSVGPDAEEIPDEERRRRLREVLADLYYGDRGYEIQKHIDRLMDESN